MSVAGEGCVTDEAPGRGCQGMLLVGPRAAGAIEAESPTDVQIRKVSIRKEGTRFAMVPSGAT